MERTMGPAEEKIKIIDEVILKRELTEAEKKEMLSLKNDELIAKYKSYIEIESSKGYQNNKLVMTKEFKNLTETAVIYDKDNNSMKMEIKYKDNSLKNGTARSYTNNKLVQEMVFENSTAILLREYHDNGNLAAELPANGEAKTYYENGIIKNIANYDFGGLVGLVKNFDEEGNYTSSTFYEEGSDLTKWQFFYKDGKSIKKEGMAYDMGEEAEKRWIATSEWKYYSKVGKLQKIETYENGEIIRVEKFK